MTAAPLNPVDSILAHHSDVRPLFMLAPGAPAPLIAKGAVIEAVAVAYGDNSASWRAAVRAVLSGPDSLAGVTREEYLRHLTLEMTRFM